MRRRAEEGAESEGVRLTSELGAIFRHVDCYSQPRSRALRPEKPAIAMTQRRLKNTLVVVVGLALASLGVYNIVLKATWTLMDDGVFWTPGAPGARRRPDRPGGPASRAGVRAGDILLAVDGEEVLSPARLEAPWLATPAGEPPHLHAAPRATSERPLDVTVQPLPRGDSQRLLLPVARRLLQPGRRDGGDAAPARRPRRRCTSTRSACCSSWCTRPPYTGKLEHRSTGSLFWTDYLAGLFLPVVFLHFCLTFPERRLRVPAAVAGPRALHAGAGADRGGGHEPGALRLRRGARGAVGHRRGHRSRRSRSTSPPSSRSPSPSCSTPTGARAA